MLIEIKPILHKHTYIFNLFYFVQFDCLTFLKNRFINVQNVMIESLLYFSAFQQIFTNIIVLFHFS